MCKRVLLIIALCIGVSGMLETRFMANSWGACKIYLGKLCCSDPTVETFLNGVGNTDINNVAVCAALAFRVTGQCLNPAGNADNAQGEAFYKVVTFAGEDLLHAEDLMGERGKAMVPITFESIGAKIESGLCPNPQWELIDWAITEVYVYHGAYQANTDKKTGEVTVYTSSELCRRCEPYAEFGSDPDCGVNCEDLPNTDICEELFLDTMCYSEVESWEW